MKTAYSIYLDYKKALRDAAALEQAAGEIKEERIRIETGRNYLASEWSGEAAEEFSGKLMKAEAKLGSLEKKILETADMIRRTALAAYRAEQRAIELASKRTY